MNFFVLCYIIIEIIFLICFGFCYENGGRKYSIWFSISKWCLFGNLIIYVLMIGFEVYKLHYITFSAIRNVGFYYSRLLFVLILTFDAIIVVVKLLKEEIKNSSGQHSKILHIAQTVISAIALLSIVFAWMSYEKSIESLRPRLIVNDFVIYGADSITVAAGANVRDFYLNSSTSSELAYNFISLDESITSVLNNIIKEKEARDSEKKYLTKVYIGDNYYLLYDFCSAETPIADMLLITNIAKITLQNDGNPINRIIVDESLTLKRDESKDPWFEMNGNNTAYFYIGDNSEIEIPIAFLLPLSLIENTNEYTGLEKLYAIIQNAIAMGMSEGSESIILNAEGKNGISIYKSPGNSLILKENFDISTLGLKLKCYAEDGNEYVYSLFFEFDSESGMLEGISTSYIPQGELLSGFFNGLYYEIQRFFYDTNEGKDYKNWSEFEKYYSASSSTSEKLDEIIKKTAIESTATWRNALQVDNATEYAFLYGFDTLVSLIYDEYIASGNWKSIKPSINWNQLSEYEKLDARDEVLETCGIAKGTVEYEYWRLRSEGENAYSGLTDFFAKVYYSFDRELG